MVNIILADTHPVTIVGMTEALRQRDDFRVTSCASNPDELIDKLGKNACDVLVLDCSMLQKICDNGFSVHRNLSDKYPGVSIVVLLSSDDGKTCQFLLKAGVVCLLSKSDGVEHLLIGVENAGVHQRYMSPIISKLVSKKSSSTDERSLTIKEAEVIRLILSGMSVSEIAKRFNRTKQTISTQKKGAMRKLGLSGDAELFRCTLSHDDRLNEI